MLAVVDAGVERALLDPAHPLIGEMAHLAKLKVVGLYVLSDDLDLVEADLAPSVWALDEAELIDLYLLAAAVRTDSPQAALALVLPAPEAELF